MKIKLITASLVILTCACKSKQPTEQVDEDFSTCKSTINGALIENTKSPYCKIKTTSLDACRWTEGFWGDRARLSQEVMVPNILNVVQDPKQSPLYNNFLIAAGEKKGYFRDFLFGDGDFYKVVEAMAQTYAFTKDAELDKQMDEIIRVIAKVQRADGYITTGKIIGRGKKMNFDHTQGGNVINEEPFKVDNDHEFYNFGHLMTAACVHYRATGKTNFLDIAIKASDCLYDNFIDGSKEDAAMHWNAPHFMGLVEMYRTTGDKRYLDLVNVFIDMLGTTKDSMSPRGLAHSQKKTPFREERKAVGHAVHANYLYCGIADVVAETGDTALMASLNAIWEDVTYRKMYITGACGSHDRFAMHDDVVGEAYAFDYDLPMSRAYGETCANVGNVMWNWRMFLLNGKAEHIDVMERSIYNSSLSGISLDGKHFYYQNPQRYQVENRCYFSGQKARQAYLRCFCCPPNIVRTVAESQSYAYGLSEGKLWVNMYGANVLSTRLLNGVGVDMKQVTNYPWDGNVNLTISNIEKEAEFAIMLRIPEWAEGAIVMVNGKEVAKNLKASTYYELKRTWGKGDKVELDLPMEAILVQAHPYMEDASGLVAVQRGPIVYCLESMDLPEGVNVTDVIIPADAKFEVSYQKDLLAGVNVLKTDILVKEKQEWDNALYKPLNSVKTKKVTAQFIPYYAWNNRETTDMTVWIQVQY